jgi:hypothetical protein
MAVALQLASMIYLPVALMRYCGTGLSASGALDWVMVVGMAGGTVAGAWATAFTKLSLRAAGFVGGIIAMALLPPIGIDSVLLAGGTFAGVKVAAAMMPTMLAGYALALMCFALISTLLSKDFHARRQMGETLR